MPSDISPPNGGCAVCVPGPDGAETLTGGASAKVAGGPRARDEQRRVSARGGGEQHAERRAALGAERDGALDRRPLDPVPALEELAQHVAQIARVVLVLPGE